MTSVNAVEYIKLTPERKREKRGEYCIAQEWKCYRCKKDLRIVPHKSHRIDWTLFPDNFLKYPIHLHHSHKTGMTIGAVHAYCNAVLWQYYGE